MPATRRISNTPLLSTPAEQRALLLYIEDRPELGDALSSIMGRPLEDMTKQEKLIALRRMQKAGMALAPLRAAAKITREIIEEGAYINGDGADEERLTRKVKKQKKEIKRLRRQLAEHNPPPEGSP